MVNVFKINSDMEKQIKEIEASLNILDGILRISRQNSDQVNNEIKNMRLHLKKLSTLVNKNEEQIKMSLEEQIEMSLSELENVESKIEKWGKLLLQHKEVKEPVTVKD